MIVLQHGFTSCPENMQKLAGIFHGMGHNVLLPRLPEHGLADRMTTALTRMNSPELIAHAEDSMDIALGLGERVTYAGLSLGGVLAGHLAINRADLDRAVLISPLFCAPHLPQPVSDATAFAALHLPNAYIWWNRKLKQDLPGPSYSYPRFPTRGYGAMLQLAGDVLRAARRSKPAAGELRMVLNAADPAMNHAANHRLAATWRAHGEPVALYEFPKELGLIHDIISPEQPKQRNDITYPVLVEWISADSVPH
ncbi:MAG: hypothetical protein NVS9B1_26410 [Candidatus Dormibacteraceae bacterium]